MNKKVLDVYFAVIQEGLNNFLQKRIYVLIYEGLIRVYISTTDTYSE